MTDRAYRILTIITMVGSVMLGGSIGLLLARAISYGTGSKDHHEISAQSRQHREIKK